MTEISFLFLNAKFRTDSFDHLDSLLDVWFFFCIHQILEQHIEITHQILGAFKNFVEMYIMTTLCMDLKMLRESN